MTVKLAIPNKAVVEESLHHLEETPGATDRIYPTLATIAYILSFVNDSDIWSHRVATHIQSFPGNNLINLEQAMALPAGWGKLALWDPKIRVINGKS
ncbi:hypothetical protein [Corynebacterium lizhenjunii]|nr:hypothetical protein [Corynebacterium lizhenjunii]